MSNRLLSSTIVASALLPLAPAMANDACGAHLANTTVVCDATGNPYTDGIIYDATADLVLHLEPGAIIERAAGFDFDGISVHGPGYNFSIDAADGSSITVEGDATDGIMVTGTKGIVIESGADITAGYAGLRGWNLDATSLEDVLVSQRDDSLIRITGFSGVGVHAATDGKGSATARSAGRIESDTDESQGIYATVTNLEGGATFTHLSETGTIVMSGESTVGLYSMGAGKGTVLTSVAGSVVMTGAGSVGLLPYAPQLASEGEVRAEVHDTGTVTTYGLQSHAVWLLQGGLGPVTAHTSGTIATQGDRANGIRGEIYNATNAATLSVILDGAASIQTSGERADAIALYHDGTGDSSVLLQSNATVRTQGAGARGVYAATQGLLSLNHSASASIGASGAEAMGTYLESQGDISVRLEGPVLGTGEFGVATASIGAGSVEQLVVSTYLRGGWQADVTGTGPTSLLPSAGVYMEGSTSARLFNSGSIGAGSDRAVVAGGGDVTIDNFGLIEGFVQLSGNGALAFNNGAEATFNVRHFADTDGDGVRDAKRVAISSFGGPASVFNNATDAWVTVGDVSGAVTADATGYRVPTTGVDLRPLAGYDFALPGINQGQLLELGTFNHAGVIDLRGPAIGNSLVITGAASAGGAPGNGLFVSNGGTLLLNVELNEGLQAGGQNGSRADVLIVDGTQLGSAPTTIVLDRKEGDGALSPGNGILLVEVRNKAQSAPGVFTLHADYVHDGLPSVISGAYAYSLFHHGTGDDAADGNWYLRSSRLDLETPDPGLPEPEPAPADPDSPPVSAPRFQPGVPLYETYPANLQALNVLPTLQQRTGTRIRGIDADGRLMDAWGRAAGSTSRARPTISPTGTEHSVHSWTMQVGLDRVLAEGSEDQRLVASMAFEYGEARSDVRSIFGDGRIFTEGYGIGTMWTWYGREGLYVDAQARISRYRSDLDSRVVGRITSHHDGDGRAFSLEAGKSIPLRGAWKIIPQTQLSYSSVRFDRFTDPAGAVVSTRDADSLASRVGIAIARNLELDGRRSHVYAIGNFSHEWQDGLHTEVSGTRITRADRRQWGELGAGGSVTWDNGVRLYGEVALRSPLHDVGDSHTVQGTVGVSVRF